MALDWHVCCYCSGTLRSMGAIVWLANVLLMMKLLMTASSTAVH